MRCSRHTGETPRMTRQVLALAVAGRACPWVCPKGSRFRPPPPRTLLWDPGRRRGAAALPRGCGVGTPGGALCSTTTDAQGPLHGGRGAGR